MRKILIVVLSAAMLGCGPFRTLPRIAGHHWHRNVFGAGLYEDSTGVESASFIGANFGDPAQVCAFDKSGPCRDFEEDDQALQWLANQYK